LESLLTFIKVNGKKVTQNTEVINQLISFPSKDRFDIIEDYFPVAIVLSLLQGNESMDREFLELSLDKKTLHDIILASNRDFPEDFYKKLKKMQGNTFQEGVV